MTIKGDNMTWKYEFDVTKEYEFFLDVVSLLGASQMKREKLHDRKCYQVKCPTCNKECARMGLSRDGQRYMLLCPSCKKGMNLNSLIRMYGDEKLIYKWNQSRIKTWHDPNGWLPIKNKKPRAPKKSD